MTGHAKKFLRDARRITADLHHRKIVRTALRNYEAARDRRKAAFMDWQTARQAAAETKWEAINYLDENLTAFADKLAARGTKVHWASTPRQARDIIVEIIHDKAARCIVKSKSMTAEEIHLNEALEHAGFEVVESDLGEFIVQLRGEPPYHIVFPSMHLTRGEIRELFQHKLKDAPSDNPEDLTMVARRVLREKFINAEIGITGANFAIAETGMISITENEGNARLTAALPRTMITLLGIEKILPRLEDLALFLPMLATAGAGQLMSGYNTLYGGPRQQGESDGPVEFHVVLLDNQRTQLLANSEQRDVLHCIRCGACLNVCPIFRNIGGHTYGTTYSGPIGSVLTPHLRGLRDWKHLSYASSLCGACTEVCPVKIDLHRHLLHNRRNAVAKKFDNPLQRLAFAAWLWTMQSPTRYAIAGKLLRLGIPGFVLKSWTATREFPTPPKQSFKDYWRRHERGA